MVYGCILVKFFGELLFLSKMIKILSVNSQLTDKLIISLFNYQTGGAGYARLSYSHSRQIAVPFPNDTEHSVISQLSLSAAACGARRGRCNAGLFGGIECSS